MSKDTNFKMGTNKEEAVGGPLSLPRAPSSACCSSASSPADHSLHLGGGSVGPALSAPSSFQTDAGGFLGEFGGGGNEAEFGFSRADFRNEKLCGSVPYYERHVFLCYKNPSVWPPRVEAAEFDRLPRLLSAAVLARKADMKKEVCLTVCEGHDGTETSNGDVLIFPDMIRYRRLTHFDVDTFAEEVLVKDREWLPGTPDKLQGSYVFVCSHGSRDRRSGVCGPALVSRFKEEIESRCLQGAVSVSPCSHIGGHKFAGNVIIFGSSISGVVSGHWYGYVTPDDVPTLLEQHILKGEIVELLWRGQMALSEEEQISAQELRVQRNGEADLERSNKESTQILTDVVDDSQANVMQCCQQNGDSSCCQKTASAEKHNPDAKESDVKGTPEKRKYYNKPVSRLNSGKGSSVHKVCAMPTWFDYWEREDTYAALAVVCAAVSVAVAYNRYRQLG